MGFDSHSFAAYGFKLDKQKFEPSIYEWAEQVNLPAGYVAEVGGCDGENEGILIYYRDSEIKIHNNRYDGNFGITRLPWPDSTIYQELLHIAEKLEQNIADIGWHVVVWGG